METKKSLKRKLKALRDALEDNALNEHFDALSSAVDSYVEAEKNLKADGFPLPKEMSSQDDIAMFSDGACRGNPGPGSWAFVIQDNNGEFISQNQAVADKTTNNRMELAGAIEALKEIKKIGHSGSLFLYTDSKYVVDGIEKWVIGWKSRGWKKADKKAPENLELWQLLDQLNGELKAKFIWVKGHAGHPQNELCDQLANEALDDAGY